VQEIVAHFVGLNLHNNQCPKMAIPIGIGWVAAQVCQEKYFEY
jgi:hypothetical protein